MSGAAHRYEQQARAALDAVAVRPPAAFLWFGRRVAVAPAGRDALVRAIAERLHADFYGVAVPRPPRAGPVAAADESGSFLRALSQANCGRGAWQPGWRVEGEEEEDAIAVVRPDGLRLLAPAADCRVHGALSAVRVPKEQAGTAPGVLRALGDTPGPDGDLVRLHWSIAAAGAVTLVARVTYALNGDSVPFALDVRDNPARYGRGPAAELLLARADFDAAIGLLRRLPRALGTHLSDTAPAFTKPLARGLSLAEEPGGDQSFGEHRCGLLAEAIVAAREQGLRTDDARLHAVRERFDAAGISLDAPYLQPGSRDAYDRS